MAASCYPAERLHAFSLGKLSEPDARLIESHLQACLACEETVAAFDDATDSLLRELKRAPAASPYDADPAYQAALVKVLTPPEAEAPRDVVERPLRLRDYELTESLGRGGMGAVFRATHLRLHREVAIKLLPDRRLRDSRAVARFQREMQAIGQLDHASIVRAMDAGEIAGQHYLAMELVDGVDLGRLVRCLGPLEIAAACELVRQAAAGLAYVHERGLVHRDVKPSNVMLNVECQVKILDLGLALLDGVHGIPDELTTVGQLMGTLDYMAPEQLQDSHEVDGRADVYGLTATLYKLLTGQPPYGAAQHRSPLAKLKAIATLPAPDVRLLREDVDERLANVIARGLEHDPNARIGSMDELSAALEASAAGAPLERLVEQFPQVRRRTRAELAQQPSALQALSASLAGSEQLSERDSVGEPSDKDVSHDPASSGKGGWVRRLCIALAGGMAIGLAGWMIYLQTDKGELVISSPQDDVQLELIQEGEVQRELEVPAGQTTVRLKSGDYQLQIAGNLRGLKIENAEFRVPRGGQAAARVLTEDPPAGEQVANADRMLRYQGKTLTEWLDEFTKWLYEIDDTFSTGIDWNAMRTLVIATDPKVVHQCFENWITNADQEFSPQRFARFIHVAELLARQESAKHQVVDMVFQVLGRSQSGKVEFDPPTAVHRAPWLIETQTHSRHNGLMRLRVRSMQNHESVQYASSLLNALDTINDPMVVSRLRDALLNGNETERQFAAYCYASLSFRAEAREGAMSVGTDDLRALIQATRDSNETTSILAAYTLRKPEFLDLWVGEESQTFQREITSRLRDERIRPEIALTLSYQYANPQLELIAKEWNDPVTAVVAIYRIAYEIWDESPHGKDPFDSLAIGVLLELLERANAGEEWAKQKTIELDGEEPFTLWPHEELIRAFGLVAKLPDLKQLEVKPKYLPDDPELRRSMGQAIREAKERWDHHGGTEFTEN